MYRCIRHVFGEDLGGVRLSKPTLISQKAHCFWIIRCIFLLTGSQRCTLLTHCFLSKDLQCESEASTSLCYLVFLY